MQYLNCLQVLILHRWKPRQKAIPWWPLLLFLPQNSCPARVPMNCYLEMQNKTNPSLPWLFLRHCIYHNRNPKTPSLCKTSENYSCPHKVLHNKHITNLAISPAPTTQSLQFLCVSGVRMYICMFLCVRNNMCAGRHACWCTWKPQQG